MSQLATERYTDRLAPDSLVLVQEVLNTRAAGRPPLEDLLSIPGSATDWLKNALGEWGRRIGSVVPDVVVDDAGLAKLQSLRASLQLYLTGAVRDELAQPDQHGVHGGFDIGIGVDGVLSSEPQGDGVDWVLSAALGEVFLARRLNTWRRLKMCRNWACSVAFYDVTNNNNGVWHDVQICGNAINLRESRRRRAATRS